MELEVEYLYDQIEKGNEVRKGHNGDARMGCSNV